MRTAVKEFETLVEFILINTFHCSNKDRLPPFAMRSCKRTSNSYGLQSWTPNTIQIDDSHVEKDQMVIVSQDNKACNTQGISVFSALFEN